MLTGDIWRFLYDDAVSDFRSVPHEETLTRRLERLGFEGTRLRAELRAIADRLRSKTDADDRGR